MSDNAGAEPNWGMIGLLGHLDHSRDSTAGANDADPFSTREGQLDRLMAATGEGVGGELKPEVALKRLSEAAQRFIPHTIVDIGWTEDGGAYCSLQQIAALPEEQRPGELETIDRSGLAEVLVAGRSLVIADFEDEAWRSRLSSKKLRHAAQSQSRSAVIVPLRLGQRITGMLEFQHRQPGLY